MLGVDCCFWLGSLAPLTARTSQPAPGWAIALRTFVLLLPAIDVLSVFALRASTAGINVYKAIMRERPVHRRLYRVLCTLLIAVPPVALGFAFHDVMRYVAPIAGMFGVFPVFITPALLSHVSRRRAEQAFAGDARTPFTTWASSAALLWTIVSVGIATIVLLVVSLAVHPEQS